MDMFVKFVAAAVVSGTPLLYGTVGEILNEKSGHLNLGVEGMMSMGAVSGFMVGYYTDNFLFALIAAFIGGALGAAVYAVLTVTFMADQNVTGLTLTIFGVGLGNFLGLYYLGLSETGTLKLPPNITSRMRSINIEGLSDLPVIGKLLFSYNPFVYLGIIVAIVLWWYLKKTKIGLSLRAIGENPSAADAAGIRVTKLKYINIILGGGICGIGGVYCAMIINNGVWISNSVGGFGWIAVALVIFAAWSPVRAIFGAFVFGAFNIVRYYMPSIGIPEAFYDMLPFIVTALVLIITSVRQSKENSQPASCGINYYREER